MFGRVSRFCTFLTVVFSVLAFGFVPLLVAALSYFPYVRLGKTHVRVMVFAFPLSCVVVSLSHALPGLTEVATTSFVVAFATGYFFSEEVYGFCDAHALPAILAVASTLPLTFFRLPPFLPVSAPAASLGVATAFALKARGKTRVLFARVPRDFVYPYVLSFFLLLLSPVKVCPLCFTTSSLLHPLLLVDPASHENLLYLLTQG